MARVIDLPSLPRQPRHNNAGKSDRLTVYDSLSAFTDAAQANPPAGADRSKHGRDWDNGQSYNEAARLCRTGDLARVALSDAFMRKMEDIVGFETKTFRTVDTVAGGAPNVAAFLAGNPVNMRRRQRVMSEQAPLNIVVDLVSSGGIAADKLERRGAAVLAVARLLSGLRPVNVYAVAAGLPSGAGDKWTSSGVAVRLDSAPLDLARAAHVFGSPAVARNIMYHVLKVAVGSGGDWLSWAYDSCGFYREHGAAYWQRALGVEDCLFLAPPYLTDQAIDRPEEFVREMVAKYGKAPE